MNAILQGGELDGIARRLEKPQADIERVFAGISGHLTDAVSLLGGLTETFDRLTSALGREDLGQAVVDLKATADELVAMANAMDGERRSLQQLVVRANEISLMISRLQETVGAISVLAVNARIEATYVKAEGIDFSVFTSEIGRLARASRATIDRFSSGLNELAGLLGQAITQHDAFRNTQQRALCTVAERLGAGVRSVAGHREEAIARAEEIGRRSRAVSQTVASLIGALQIGDITRQRMEHIGHAFELLAREDADGGELGRALDDGQRMSLAAAVCRLQSAQLTQTQESFDAELRRIVDELRLLAHEAAAIHAAGGGFQDSQSRQNVSFLDELAGDLEKAMELLRDSRKARTEVDSVASAVSATLSGLVGQVDAVNALEVEMRLVGLNTALKCGRIGDQGRALDVIAQELRAYANLTVQHADAVKQGMRDIDDMAHALNRNGANDAAEHLAALERTTEAAVKHFEEAGGELDRALTSLDRDGERAAKVLEEASEIARGGDVGHLLHDVLQHVARIIAAAPAGSEDIADLRDRLMAVARRNYTMASERVIHDLFDGLDPTGKGSASAPTAKAAGSVDDILF